MYVLDTTLGKLSVSRQASCANDITSGVPLLSDTPENSDFRYFYFCAAYLLVQLFLLAPDKEEGSVLEVLRLLLLPGPNVVSQYKPDDTDGFDQNTAHPCPFGGKRDNVTLFLKSFSVSLSHP